MEKKLSKIKAFFGDVDNTLLCLKMYDKEGKRVVGFWEGDEWLNYNICTNAYINCVAPKGMTNLVQMLHDKGVKIYGLTECANSFEYNSKYNRLREVYDGIFTQHGDLIATDSRKNKVKIMKMIAKRDNLSMDEIMFVDDSYFEIMEAFEAGMFSMHTTEALERFQDVKVEKVLNTSEENSPISEDEDLEVSNYLPEDIQKKVNKDIQNLYQIVKNIRTVADAKMILKEHPELDNIEIDGDSCYDFISDKYHVEEFFRVEIYGDNLEYIYFWLMDGKIDYIQYDAHHCDGKKSYQVQDVATNIPKLALNDYTWTEIKAISESGEAPKYFKVGDTKDVTINGVTYQVAIAGFNHDTISGTNKKAGITFVTVDCIGVSQMNTTDTNEGGWASSYMRNAIMANIYYNGMDNDLKNAIKNVDKLSVLADGTTQATCDKLFLFSVSEVYGVSQSEDDQIGIGNNYYVYGYGQCPFNTSADGIQYRYFKTASNVFKKYDGSAQWLYLRSAIINGSTSFRNVHISGSCGNSYATSSGGIVLGFSI